MPNWCENVLEVRGDKRQVRRFTQQAEGQHSALLFDHFVPMPKTKENAEGDGWYEWCIAHWGTKWEACEVERMPKNDGRVIYLFETAWSPPVAWLEAVAQQFPALHFELNYQEPAMGIWGKAVGIRGKVSDEALDILDSR